MPPNDPAALLLLYRHVFEQQIRFVTAMMTAPWLAWQGGAASLPPAARPAEPEIVQPAAEPEIVPPAAEPEIVQPAAEPQFVQPAETRRGLTPRRRAARTLSNPIVQATAETEDAEDIP